MSKKTQKKARKQKMDINEKMDRSLHLPRWLRDYHYQQDVFKACEQMLGKTRNGITWTTGHIYTIDRFLRFMALHGYTLRRTDPAMPHIEDTVAEYKKKRDEETGKIEN